MSDQQPTAQHLPLDRPLVVGFGITGRAMVEAMVRRHITPVVIDDGNGDELKAAAGQIGVDLIAAPSAGQVTQLVSSASALLPSPGVPDHHVAFAAAGSHGVPVLSEFDLAAAWDSRPIAAITGTNGKTTVTTLVTDAVNRSGSRAVAVGNTDTPLVAALEDDDVEVFVVEASSFRLAHSRRFSPDVAAWLNFAPDHLDAHASLDSYVEAKASIWSHLTPGASAVANGDDPVVVSYLPRAVDAQAVIHVFSLDPGSSPAVAAGFEPNWIVDGSGDQANLVGPNDFRLPVSQLKRRQPHDLANGLAVAAVATASGAGPDAVAGALTEFEGMAHRVELVGERDGVQWYNDSKATVPHATLAAVGGFDSVVLIAGGRNKGLELDSLKEAVPPVRAVVATGDAADEISDIFEELVPVSRAASMIEAVQLARASAKPGDVVLLSPSCTSFDWYPNYAARGSDFRDVVTKELRAP